MKQEYSNHEIEAGIDEAGRGPLFGRVYTACVILPKSSSNSLNPSYIKDSKKFTSKKKLKEAYDYVMENALDYSITYCDEKTIDKMTILQATIHGMHKAINGLKDQMAAIQVNIDGKKAGEMILNASPGGVG